mgnify:CR=1 FL=1
MKKVTKKLARAFAQEFFHTNKFTETWSEDNVCYKLSIVQLEIFPCYGDGTGQPYPYGAVTLAGYQTGTVKFVEGKAVYASLAEEAINLMHRLSQTLLMAVDENNITNCNSEKCIVSNLKLNQAVVLAQQIEKF